MHEIADAIEARAQIALVESSDTGQPIRYMSKAALRGVDYFLRSAIEEHEVCARSLCCKVVPARALIRPKD